MCTIRLTSLVLLLLYVALLLCLVKGHAPDDHAVLVFDWLLTSCLIPGWLLLFQTILLLVPLELTFIILLQQDKQISV